MKYCCHLAKHMNNNCTYQSDVYVWAAYKHYNNSVQHVGIIKRAPKK